MPAVVERPEAPESAPSHAANKEAIAELVSLTGRPEAEVTRVFAAEYARLRSTARITDYLVLFAFRRTRDVFAETAEAGQGRAG
jgi:hypothetical protein